MAIWGTPLTPADDIHDIALWLMLTAAINERYEVAWGFGAPLSHATGDNFVAPGFWSNSITLQSIFLLTYNRFIDHTIVIEGNNNSPALWQYLVGFGAFNTALWTLPNLRAAALLPTTLYYNWNGVTQTTTPTLNNTLLRRKRPREILSATATVDAQGNAAAAGQLAYLMGDDPRFTPPESASLGLGTLYVCVASGNWQRVTVGSADVLDNTLAAPNAIAENNTNFGLIPPGVGYLQQGDYVLAHLPNELMAMIDLMRNTYVDSFTGIGPVLSNSSPAPAGGLPAQMWASVWNNNTASGAFDPSLAVAEANTAANWPTAAGGGPFATLPKADYDITNFGGTDFSTVCNHADVTPQLVFSPVATQKHRAVWYCFADTQTAAGSNPISFDTNGDAVLSGQWHTWNTGADTNAATDTATKLGNAANIPSIGATSPPGFTSWNGYQVEEIVAVLIWNIAGGFTYCTVTV